jgi:hypothetical protein
MYYHTSTTTCLLWYTTSRYHNIWLLASLTISNHIRWLIFDYLTLLLIHWVRITYSIPTHYTLSFDRILRSFNMILLILILHVAVTTCSYSNILLRICKFVLFLLIHMTYLEYVNRLWIGFVNFLRYILLGFLIRFPIRN